MAMMMAMAPSDASGTVEDVFPAYIPLSADSCEVLSPVDQPLEIRKPAGVNIDTDPARSAWRTGPPER